LRLPSVSDDVLKKYKLAGAIAREARDFGASHIKAGMSSLELVSAIEGLIRSKGAECCFPVNIGVNDVAAHYTPSKDNDIRFRLGDVVKIDVGSHVDGYPADTSATVEVGTRNYTSLIKAADDALKMSVEMVAPGTPVAVLGETIGRTIRGAGFRPIENLTGHSMERFNLHAGISIPNIATRDKAVVSEGMVVAIEPFSTTGTGKVGGRSRGNIFRIVRDRKASPEITALFSRMQSRFGGFPFASRWCDELHPEASVLVPKMLRMGMIMNYPVLTEVGKGVVAQAEHSVLVTKDSCIVLT
jgi:methionyl aminopeptidase